jgi:hypothetical protein
MGQIEVTEYKLYTVQTAFWHKTEFLIQSGCNREAKSEKLRAKTMNTKLYIVITDGYDTKTRPEHNEKSHKLSFQPFHSHVHCNSGTAKQAKHPL